MTKLRNSCLCTKTEKHEMQSATGGDLTPGPRFFTDRWTPMTNAVIRRTEKCAKLLGHPVDQAQIGESPPAKDRRNH